MSDRPVSSRRARMVAPWGLLVLAASSLVGCDARPFAAFSCDDFSVTLEPGACKEIQMPCPGLNPPTWLPADRSESEGFAIDLQPEGISFETTRTADAGHWSMCAAADTPTIVNFQTQFTYTRGTWSAFPAFGVGSLTLTVKRPLVVAASSTPATIDWGGSAQLLAEVTGGAGPYSYAWTPAAALSAADVASPIARPTVTTDYTVVVTDVTGDTRTTSTAVTVRPAVSVSASPARIDPGQQSQLATAVIGGKSPYSYSWSPTDTLNDPLRPDPIATPVFTTIYTASVTDAAGVTRAGSVEVGVNVVAKPTADPATIDAGNTSQLDANPGGGDGAYVYSWSPVSGLDNPAVRNPVASPVATATYTVAVTDGHGLTASSPVTVTVNPGPPLPPSDFTLTVIIVAPLGSHGVIVGSMSGNVINCLASGGPTSVCSQAFAPGTTTQVRPGPGETGSGFSQWSGCDSLVGSRCNVTMNSNRTLTATFIQ